MLPDFLIVGAMKCGTSTLAAQLGAQQGIFMTEPKEPNFFSDDTQFARGPAWYASLLSDAKPDDLKGEASTHYTKLPTYPECLPRMTAALTAPKLIYIIRNPIQRVISHYIHEWTMGVIRTDIETALSTHPELISYGCYGMQIEPFVQTYGAENIFLTSLEAMESNPQSTLESVCNFLGYDGDPTWQDAHSQENTSSERIKRFPLHDILIDHPVSQSIRRSLVPQSLRDRIKRRRQIKKRPDLSLATTKRLQAKFTEDFETLNTNFPNRTDLEMCYPFLRPSFDK